MQQLGPTTPAPILPTPAPAPAPEAKKIEGSWWGKYILGMVTRHETPLTLPDDSKCRRLVEEASVKSTQLLFEDNESAFLEGGREGIELAIKDVAMQVFVSLALQNKTDESSDEERIDHVVCTVIQIIKEEFATGVPNKEHFKRIANTLLITAYPKREEDERLPSGLRTLISTSWSSRTVQWMAKKATGRELSWEKLTETFAGQLEELYTSINRAGQLQWTASSDTDALVSGLIDRIDASTRTGSPLHLSISGLSSESNEFLNDFLTRLLQNSFTNPQEAELLGEARSWLLDRMKVSLTAILYTIFSPRQGQTQKERNFEFSGEILSGASVAMPEASQKIRDINSAAPDELRAMMVLYKDDLAHLQDRPALEKILKKWKGSEEEQKTARELLKSIVMTSACRRIFSEQLHPAELQTIFPSFVSAKAFIDQLYAGISPYLIEITEQLDSIEEKGKAAHVALNASAEGNELIESKLTDLVDKILEQTRGALEKKAEAETLAFTGFAAIDDVFCHLLKPTTTSTVAAKGYVDSQLRNLITLVLKEAIAKKDPELKDPEKALADIANDALKIGRRAALQFAELKAARSSDEADEALPPLDEKAFLKDTARTILEGIISRETFNSLLPPFLKGNTFWDDTADLLADKVLKGLFAQTEKAQRLSAAGTQKLEVKELRELLGKLQTSILEQLEKPKQAEQAGNSLDRLTNSLLSGEGVKDIVKDVLPTTLESILAYHVNPKAGVTSEDRAAALAMELLKAVEKGVKRVDGYESLHDEAGRNQWLLHHGVTDEVLAAYRIKKNIPPEASFDMRSFFFHQAAEEMLGILLPKDLLEQIIPPEFSGLQIESLLADFSYNYIKDAYNYSRIMKQVARPNDKTSQELVRYAKLLIDNSLSTGKKESWMQGVVGKIFSSTGQERELLDDFITNVLLGSIAFILKRDVTAELPEREVEDLALLALPLAKQSQELFRVLNEPGSNAKKYHELQELFKLSDEEMGHYKKIFSFSMNAPSIDSFAYSVAARLALEKLFPGNKWEQLVPEIARSVFTKDAMASLLAGVYETIHQTQKVLVKEGQSADKFMKQHAGLSDYLEKNLVNSIRESLIALGKTEEKLNAELPQSLDQLVKHILRGDNEESEALRDLLMRRGIYSSLNELLNDPESSVLDKVKGLIASYQANDDGATADLLLEIALSKELRGTPLVESVLNPDTRASVAALVQQVHESQAKTLKKGAEAQKYLYSLPGVRPFVEDMLVATNGTIDEMAKKGTEKLSPEFPDYIDDLVKEALRDKTLNPIAKEAIKQVLYIVLQQVLTPAEGQTVEARVLVVMEKLIQAYDSKDPKASGTAWLKELLPEDTLKEILPPFLHQSVTHEKITEWFLLPYVAQVTKQKEEVEAENKLKPDLNVSNAQRFARQFLVGYTTSLAPEKGLLGFEGAVREIERSLLSTLNVTEPSESGVVSSVTQPYLDAVVAKAVRTLENQGQLHPDFLSQALTEALPLLGGEGTPPADMPTKAEFLQESGKKLMEMLFPNGKEDLPVPDVAKNTIFEKTKISLERVLKEVTEAESRVLWTIDRMIPFATENEAEIKSLQKEAEGVRRLQDLDRMLRTEGDPDKREIIFKEAEKLRRSLQSPESLFKSTLLKVAVLQADVNMKKAGYGWFLRGIAKFFTRLFVYFSLRSRIYSFVSGPENDDKFRAAIWSFLTFKSKKAQNDEQIKNGLEGAAETMLRGSSIVPGFLSGRAAPSIAGYFRKQNITDLLP